MVRVELFIAGRFTWKEEAVAPDGVLRVVLPEIALAGGMRRADRVGREGLAHRDENYVTRVPPRGRAGAGDAGLYGLQALFNCVHNAPDFPGAPRGWRRTLQKR